MFPTPSTAGRQEALERMLRQTLTAYDTWVKHASCSGRPRPKSRSAGPLRAGPGRADHPSATTVSSSSCSAHVDRGSSCPQPLPRVRRRCAVTASRVRRAARLGSRALSLALASRVGGAAFRTRVRVHCPPDTDTIETYLRTVLGRKILVSMYLGPARANRKPVLQLLTPQGQPAGFAKIGTHPLSRALVQAERDALAQLEGARLSGILIPRVQHYGEWHEMNILVLGALPLWHRRRPVQAAQLAAAMNSVASVGGLRLERLAAGSYWQRLISRLAAADASAEREALRRALDALGTRAGDVQLLMGSWHGDWTPWNMANTSVGLLVWDWERFTHRVPLGFDALHYKLQRDVVPGRRDPRAAAADCIKDAPQTLAALSIDAEASRITAVLYLADLATRYLTDRQAQAGARLGAAGSWLVPAITYEVGRLCSS